VKRHYPETEWLKLIDAEAAYGISRPEIFRAVVRGDIAGSHLLKLGKTKGIWLVNKASVEAYIRSFMPGGSRHHNQFAETK
jgi:hypothetical protein